MMLLLSPLSIATPVIFFLLLVSPIVQCWSVSKRLHPKWLQQHGLMMMHTAVYDDRVSFSSENVVGGGKNDYYIQQASNKAMALDIKVFR